MIYKVILGKQEIEIDEEERDFFVNNKDNRFIILKTGEVINPSFVQGIFIDEEKSREENSFKLKTLPRNKISENDLDELKKSFNQENKFQIKSASDILNKISQSLTVKNNGI
jgi:phage tail tube protein FII